MTIAAGTFLGRYEIRSLLGAGGMGEIYLAWDPQLERTVALKILPADVASDQRRMRRFTEEAKAASALNHPSILIIYEIGQAGSTHFIATEFIDGETLRSALASSTPMEMGDVLDIATQVASALAAAHAAGIVHRDIKPENIMLRRDSYVKVLDFGLAKLTPKSSARPTVDSDAWTLIETEPGVVIGTAQYMSPEQARGLPLDARTDIFSMGVVLYEMVAGRRPFEGKTNSDVIVSILERRPPALATYRREIPETLEWIVSKALRKDREERYQTAKDLATDLRKLKLTLEIDAELERSKHSATAGGVASSDNGERAAAETVKRPAQISDSSCIKSPVLKRRRKAIDSLAVLPLVNASGDPNAEYLSDGITESIINSLSQVPKLRVMARSTVFRYKGQEVDPQTVGRELGVRAVLTGRALQLGDQIVVSTELVNAADGSQLWGEQYRRSITDIFAVQEEISREISQKMRLKLTGAEKKRLTKRYTENPEAYRLYLKGRYHHNKFDEVGFRRAIEYFQLAIERDPTYALAYAGLADCYVSMSTFSVFPSKEGFPKARAAVAKALEIDDTLAEAHTSLARIKSSYDWEFAAAEEEFKRAIELNQNYATAHHLYGRHLMWMGRLDEALGEITLASELDPLSLIINADLSAPLFFARQYDRAIESLRKTLEMDPYFPITHWRLGAAYEYKEMYEEALAEFQKAIELSGSSADKPTMLAVLAHAYAASGRRDQAGDILDRLKEQSQLEYVSPCDIAEIHAALGEKDQAFAWLEKAYQVRSSDMLHLKVSVFMDSLRLDPRFADLLRRVGFTE